MNLKIISKGSESIVSLLDLSKNLDINSEIYSIHEDGEFYLGVISHKTLVFLATEFADYALKNYAKREIPEAEVCLSLTKKWIEDDCSVSKEELRAAAYAAANAADYAVYAAGAAAYAAADAAADAAANAADAAADAADSAYAAGKDREREFIRQGKFILYFLKSGKHLFLV
jgi:hypothetical protein